jgi:hypothetical protein
MPKQTITDPIEQISEQLAVKPPVEYTQLKTLTLGSIELRTD